MTTYLTKQGENRLKFSSPILSGQDVNPGWFKAVGTEGLTYNLTADNPTQTPQYVASIVTSTSGAGLAITSGFVPAWTSSLHLTGSVFWKNDGGDSSVRLDLVLGTGSQRRYAVRFEVASLNVAVVNQGGGLTDYKAVAEYMGGEWWRLALTGQASATPPTGDSWLYVLRGNTYLASKVFGAQIVVGNEAGPYTVTSGTAVTTPGDFVVLNPSALSQGAGAKASQHRGGTGAMTRQMHGRYDMAKATDRFMSRANAAKVSCWWSNNVAVSIHNHDTWQIDSGFIVNKSSPVKGLAEPYSDQYSVSIELEGF